MLKPGKALCAHDGESDLRPHGSSVAADQQLALLDPDAIASLRQLDPTGKNQLLQRVVAAFQTSTARLLPQLLEASRGGDADGVRHVAHTLKSSSASLGGKSLSALCAEVETRIRVGDVADLGTHVASMCTEADRLLRALEQLSQGQQ